MMHLKLVFLALVIFTFSSTAENSDEHVGGFALAQGQVKISNGGESPIILLAGQESEIDEEDIHERVKRSPWGGRRRRRWSFRGRRISRAVRRTVRNVGKAVRKVPTAVKRVVRKIPKEVKRVTRQASKAVRRTVRKASRVVRKTVQNIKRTVRKVKEIPRKTGKALRKIRDKIKEKVGQLIAKKKEEEIEEVVIPEPIEPEPTYEPKPTNEPITGPAVVTKPPCDDECETVKTFSKDADFFKQCHCAFYLLKRGHQDFFLDRNKNKTLEKLVTAIADESVTLYLSYAEALLSLKHRLSLQSRQEVKQYCLQTSKQNCLKPTTADVVEFLRLKCLKPCAGFSGCIAEDKTLAKFADDAAKTHDRKLNSAF